MVANDVSKISIIHGDATFNVVDGYYNLTVVLQWLTTTPKVGINGEGAVHFYSLAKN